jgi:hypothetical protein
VQLTREFTFEVQHPADARNPLSHKEVPLRSSSGKHKMVVAPCGHVGRLHSSLSTCPQGLALHARWGVALTLANRDA